MALRQNEKSKQGGIMSDSVMASIDEAANNFFETRDPKYFNQFAKYATPVIRGHISKVCANSNWDTEELFSILLSDMWRLFQRWERDTAKKFHWLMLRQLRNKTINFIHAQMGRPHKVCPVCAKRQQDSRSVCEKCKSSLRLADIILEEAFDYTHSCTPDYLAQLANTQLVAKLLTEVKREDPITHKILTMLLDGCTKTEISNEVQIAQNAINNRIRKCQEIVNNLT